MSRERIPTRRGKHIPTKAAAAGPVHIPIADAVRMWIADGKAQGFSAVTLQSREQCFQRFVWWMANEAGLEPTLPHLTPTVVRQFLSYVREPNAQGRFGCGHANASRKAKPATVATYFRDLRTFVHFCTLEGLLAEEHQPLANVKPPRVPKEQITPFTPKQVQALLDATTRTVAPERNRAILLMLLDTGLRVSELTSLAVGDVTSETGQLSVVGKGGKPRSVYLGTASRRAIRLYLRKCRKEVAPDDPLFTSEGGHTYRSALTPTGVRQMVQELGKVAGLEGVRCSPHTLRHTFAISFLRGGGNLFSLQQLMGHADLTVLRRYVNLAESDLEQAHRRASPADTMKLH